MDSESKSIKLFTAAKELNIGTGTIVDFLATKGFKIQKHPTTILDGDMYDSLVNEFRPAEISKDEFQKVRKNNSSGTSENSKYALVLIEKCLQTKSVLLDLGNCGLTSNHFVSGSHIDRQLKRCTHLQTLILSNEWWTWEGRDKWWIRNESKNSGAKNFLSQIPKAISSLQSLTKLICCGATQANWKIKEVNLLSQNTNLNYLDLRDNEIENVKALNSLTKLQSLFINRNRIVSISALFKLIKISHLDIHTNQIENIKGISNMTNLRILDIHNNQIKSIEDLPLAEHLNELYIEENEIREIDSLQGLVGKDDKFHLKIDDNPFVKEYQLKLTRFENHLPFIKNLLQRQYDNSKRSDIVYPVKILILGNHSSGKSSLVNYLTANISKGSTHILRVVNYYLNSSNNAILPDAIFFDFGGQDFYHGVYKAFISEDTLQIILFNDLTDYNGAGKDVDGLSIINFDRKYWLGQKNYLEKISKDKAMYLMVQTFAEKKTNESPLIDFRNYPGYLKSFYLSLDEAVNKTISYEHNLFKIGKEYFKAYLNLILTNRQKTSNEPNWYIDFLKYIFSQGDKNHESIKIIDIVKKYRAPDLSNDEILERLKIDLINLHRHGLVLYYHKIIGLNNIVWISPQKLVEHIQNNILNKTFIDKSKGIIPKNDFEKIVKDEKILLLLHAQNVIFLHKPTANIDEEEYIIPNFLPLVDKTDASLKLFTFGLDKPNFVMKFNDYIPFGFINQMICFYGKQPDAKKFWRNQLLFTLEKEILVLIELDFEALKINITFKKSVNCVISEDLLIEYLFFGLIALYWNLPTSDIFNFGEFISYKSNNLKDSGDFGSKIHIWETLRTSIDYVPEDLYISLDDVKYINYYELFTLNEQDFKINSFNVINNRINIFNQKETPVSLYKPFTFRKLFIMKKIFFSYSRYDRRYRDEFEVHFSTLKRQGLIATWYDGEIEAGANANDEILQNLKQADIIICLLSPNFMANDYIWDIEMLQAKKHKKTIIPITIKACDYKKYFSEYFEEDKQGFLTQKQFDIEQIADKTLRRDIIWIASEQNEARRDEYYNFIVEEIKKIIEK